MSLLRRWATIRFSRKTLLDGASNQVKYWSHRFSNVGVLNIIKLSVILINSVTWNDNTKVHTALRVNNRNFFQMSGICNINTTHAYGSFEVLTEARMKMDVFWVFAPCSKMEVYRGFRCACCFHHLGYRTSDTSLNFYQTTRCKNPEDSNLHNIWNRQF